jgi:alpha/beta superfamily hydrolase
MKTLTRPRHLTTSSTLHQTNKPPQFGPRKLLQGLYAALPEPKRLAIIDGADHFFAGRLKELREAIQSWMAETLRP